MIRDAYPGSGSATLLLKGPLLRALYKRALYENIILPFICDLCKPQSKQEDAEAGKVSGEHQKGAPEKEKEGQGATVQFLSPPSHPRSTGRSF